VLVRGAEDDAADARFVWSMRRVRRRSRRGPRRALGVALLIAGLVVVVGVFAVGAVATPA
jgi:hypothetical protein